MLNEKCQAISNYNEGFSLIGVLMCLSLSFVGPLADVFNEVYESSGRRRRQVMV